MLFSPTLLAINLFLQYVDFPFCHQFLPVIQCGIHLIHHQLPNSNLLHAPPSLLHVTFIKHCSGAVSQLHAGLLERHFPEDSSGCIDKGFHLLTVFCCRPHVLIWVCVWLTSIFCLRRTCVDYYATFNITIDFLK